MQACLLDTDILSEVLKRKNPTVLIHAGRYIQQHGQIGFSSFTRYEILRWIKARNANRQLARFQTFCSHSLVYAVTDAVLDRAADLWAVSRRIGHPVPDADLLIAATAQEHGLELVTGNAAHFAWTGQTVLDWRIT